MSASSHLLVEDAAFVSLVTATVAAILWVLVTSFSDVRRGEMHRWSADEFGGMGLEGAVKLAYRKELEAIADPDARKDRYESMVAGACERGTALNTATYFEIDDVIDPAATRALVAAVLLRSPRGARHDAPSRDGRLRRRYVDSW